LNYTLFGKIFRVHGLKGAVKLAPFLPVKKGIRRVRIMFPDGRCSVSQVKIVGFTDRLLIVKIKGYDSKEEAEQLKGCMVEVPKFRLPPDNFYINDLIGIDVFEEKGRYIGILQEVFNTSSNDVFRITDDRRDVLFPALKRLVKKVDLKNRRMVVTMPEGLEEAASIPI